ncbi:hypothetical protein [Nocardia inohanensis]|uniref:hypothetical protein n=1 Tax=Nocardia inohanensis TaxID=209246 RepID=UPI00083598FE|nr:hypothetical protein [Nocardia inohanensis]
MLFDIRTIVGGLLACYGLILIIVALSYDSTVQHMKTGGIDINLWAGIGMLIAGLVFFTWVRLRPVREAEEASNQTPE